ncbi:ABC transporter permease [Corallococcus exiguus]|uniref:ABC transporter permease n=1 Tax=Corallococcus TaxID=83461 RepID=UPI000ED3C310|nr:MULTISPECIES: ABC transporter permease [Corallococcus]NNB84092.1 ABC transporter permease [Corallococcus exiguus]NNC04432.1 ABC transporter permease [Corallococcus exiguus]NPC48827.1 ABC transporter permease [Corallococcus exiguus]RKH83571.1 ABC transporter permease [Corallococcus sp. AB032C]
MTGSLPRILAVLLKEFTQLRRDRITYAMILLMPVMQLLIFGYAINMDPRHLPAAVLSHDTSTLANSVVAALERTGYVDVRYLPRSDEELDQLIRRGQVMLGITIPPDFSRRVLKGERAQILAEADASDPQAAAGALAAVSVLPTEALRNERLGLGTPRSTAPAFEVVVHRRYNPESRSPFHIVPGLLGIILSMTLVMMTAMAVTRERERGTMETLLSTPATPAEIMVGKLTPYVVVGLVQTVVVLGMARGLFSVPMARTPAGWLALACGIVLFIVGNLSLGYLISTVARSQLQAMQMSMFYMLPSIFLSGFAFPFLGLPPWARVLGEIIPVTHFLRIVRGALLKDQVLADMGNDLLALGLFVLAVSGAALARSRTTLD